MTLPAWSFSSLTKYETCPRQYYVVKVLKAVVEPPTVHTEWGVKVHEALEYRVRDKTPLPKDLQQFEHVAAQFDDKRGRVFTELEMALTRNLTPTEWAATDCWYRGIIDVGVDYGKRAVLMDYKTGKVKSDHDQMNLFAAAYAMLAPEVQEFRTGYIWLAHDKLTRKDISREEVPAIWNDFRGRVNRLQASYDKDKWLPKPSGLCRGWCPVGREHCEFWCPKKTK